jgi:hypothetical protein
VTGKRINVEWVKALAGVQRCNLCPCPQRPTGWHARVAM